jgi:hypothetical protein
MRGSGFCDHTRFLVYPLTHHYHTTITHCRMTRANTAALTVPTVMDVGAMPPPKRQATGAGIHVFKSASRKHSSYKKQPTVLPIKAVETSEALEEAVKAVKVDAPPGEQSCQQHASLDEVTATRRDTPGEVSQAMAEEGYAKFKMNPEGEFTIPGDA